MRVEIRFAARKGDFDGALAHFVYLVEIGRHILRREVNEMIRGRRAFDIAIGAFDIALRSCVKPQRIQFLEEDLGTLLALRCNARVFEFFRIEYNGHAGLLSLRIRAVMKNTLKVTHLLCAVCIGMNLSLSSRHRV